MALADNTYALRERAGANADGENSSLWMGCNVGIVLCETLETCYT